MAAQEARFADLRSGTQKVIRWAGTPRERTPMCLLYLHGFSASRQETQPLSSRLSGMLGANAYYPRLSGHGRGLKALGEASVQDWLVDTRQAFEVATRIGEKVLIVACSTGATLAAWLAATHPHPAMHSLVMISPNYGPADKAAWVLNMPLGLRIAKLLRGPIRGFAPANPLHARYWTKRYPMEAAREMMRLLPIVRGAALESISVPSLVLYSEADRVLSVPGIKKFYQRLGGHKHLHQVRNSNEPNQHVLAGNILSPASNGEVLRASYDFVQSVAPR